MFQIDVFWGFPSSFSLVKLRLLHCITSEFEAFSLGASEPRRVTPPRASPIQEWNLAQVLRDSEAVVSRSLGEEALASNEQVLAAKRRLNDRAQLCCFLIRFDIVS